MIEQCRYCKGQGFLISGLPTGGLSQEKIPCPVCNGAGQIDVNIDPDLRVRCNVCKGEGFTFYGLPASGLYQNKKVCNSCKGIGEVEMPRIGPSNPKTRQNNISNPPLPRPITYEFDVAVSFAGEDRKIVEEYVNLLKSKSIQPFYDNDSQVDLWGANLIDKLDEIYRTKALCCVIFISENYAEKVWTALELQAAKERALKSIKDNIEYILPVKLDDTEIPGLHNIGYIELANVGIEKLTEMTITKVESLKLKIAKKGKVNL